MTRHNISYNGEGWEVFILALTNFFLNLFSLGFYRFWALSRIRRYFWSAFELDGSPLVYDGKGEDIFWSATIWLLVLMTLTLVLGSLSLLNFSTVSWFFDGLSLSLFLLLGLTGLYGRCVYIAAQTRWRGQRFSVDLGPWYASWRLALYALITLFSIGLLEPLARRGMSQFLLRHSRVENKKVFCNMRLIPLVWPHLALLFSLALFFVYSWQFYQNNDAAAVNSILFSLSLIYLSYLWSRARYAAELINSVTIAGLKAKSHFGLSHMLWLLLEGLFWGILLYLFLSIPLSFLLIFIVEAYESQLFAELAKIVEHKQEISNSNQVLFIKTSVAFCASFLISLVLGNALIKPILTHRFYQLIAKNLDLKGTLEPLSQTPYPPNSSIGEGLGFILSQRGL